MKSIYTKFLLLLTFVVMLVSCTKDDSSLDNNDNTSPDALTAEFSLGSPSISTVDITLTTQNAIAYAYELTTDLNQQAQDAAIMFAEATTGDIDSDSTTLTLSGLNGETSYKLFICVEFADNAGYSEVKELEFTTEGFTEFVTLLPSDNKFSVKFHIEVPAGEMVAYTVLDLETYIGLTEYGYTDPDFLQDAEEHLNIITDSKTVTFDGWYATDTDTGETYIDAVPQPGQSLRLIVSAMQDGGTDYNGRQVYEAKFDYTKYAETIANYGEVSIDSFWLTEYYEIRNFNVEPPTLVDAPAECSIESITTRSVEFDVTLNDKINAVAYIHVDDDTWQTILDELGYDGAIYWATNNSYVSYEDFTYTATSLEVGTTYQLILIGRANDDGTEHSVNIVEFTPIEPTKAAPEVLVTAIAAPEGEVESALKVWFNIKSPTKDAIYFNYLCNDTREWIHMLNSGYSYSDMMASAYTIDDGTSIDAVNSDEGYNICFDSWEETSNRLVVSVANDEETMSDPEDESARADNTTIALPYATPVESSLFEDLKGEWLVSAKLMNSTYNSATDSYTYSPSSTVTTATITISDSPEYPAVCPDYAYDLYPSMTTEEVDALYTEFIASAIKYEEKTRGQNRLVCEGLALVDYFTTYLSPFDLFVDESYSAAVTTDDLFLDYGPKWNLQIGEGDTVTIPLDPTVIPSLANHEYFEIVQCALDINNPEYSTEVTELEVIVSEDKNTLTVQPKVKDGVTYYYSAGYMYNYSYSPMFICSTFELTRISSSSSAMASPSPKIDYPTLSSTLNITPTHNRTRLVAPLKSTITKRVEGEAKAWDSSYILSAERYIEMTK